MLFKCQGDFGPFFPQIPAKVPLWLAVALKKRGKCAIRRPEWMSIGEFMSINVLEHFSLVFSFCHQSLLSVPVYLLVVWISTI